MLPRTAHARGAQVILRLRLESIRARLRSGPDTWRLPWIDSNDVAYLLDEVERSQTPDHLVRENLRLRDALNEIAAWPDGQEVNGRFDEPASARIAREALKKRAEP